MKLALQLLGALGALGTLAGASSGRCKSSVESTTHEENLLLQKAATSHHSSLLLREDQNGSTLSVHSIYTLGCDKYQLVQAVALDHSWRHTGNTGPLTRIVAGCKSEEEALLRTSPLRDDPHFKVFFAQGDLSTIPGSGDVYPARSRPYAISQWLKSALPKESVVVILDPDFIFQQPITEHPGLLAVRPGRMLAQQYELGDHFIKGFAHANETAPTSPSVDEIAKGYATGPPWALHMEDLKSMLPDWGRYTDAWPVEEGLLREQEAFCMAALRHGVRADGQSGLMISNWLAGSEAWSHSDSTPDDWAPYVLHYCQTYEYGQWYFHKALVADKWYASQGTDNSVPGPLGCGAPLLQEPPALPHAEQNRDSLKKAWMISKLLPALNRAFTAYRALYCPAEAPGDTGLMRTMAPQDCHGRSSTRYRVLLSDPVSWFDSNVPRGDKCSQAAQSSL